MILELLKFQLQIMIGLISTKKKVGIIGTDTMKFINFNEATFIKNTTYDSIACDSQSSNTKNGESGLFLDDMNYLIKMRILHLILLSLRQKKYSILIFQIHTKILHS